LVIRIETVSQGGFMGANKRLGRWLVYGLCLAPAVIMLGFYWLQYIPDQREYFMNLRFRTLSIIGDQLRSKIESLATSFENATNFYDPDQYIKALVSDLSYEPCPKRVSAQPSVELGSPANSVRFHSAQGCVADASMFRIFSPFTRDDLFDDVVIANESGRVVYQRSTSSPRVAALSELVKTGADAKTTPKEGSGMDADAVRSVRLDDSEFMLLLQPLTISSPGGQPARLMVGGLVRSTRLASEAHHVPPKYLLVLFAPVLVVVLSGPFLKILLLTRTGRLAFRDMALLSLFTLFAAGLVTVLMASWYQYVLSEQQTDPDLEQFAKSLNGLIVSDVKGMRNALEEFDKDLPTSAGEIHDRTDLLASNLPAEFANAPAPFDFVFWTNSDGCQVAKWSTKRFNTERVDQKTEEHFRNVVAKRLWQIEGKPFTLQTRLSQTTSQLIVVLAIPSRHAGLKVAGCGKKEPSPIVSAAIVASLRSVSAPLVPPGAGFAVFEPEGRVLFHSSSERNLHENLFTEIDAPDRLRAGVIMRVGQSLSANYRGLQYRFQIQPVTQLGIPWSIAVFREREPRQAMIGLVWFETLVLFVSSVCLMASIFALVSVILRAGWGWSLRRQVDFFLAHVWPDPARSTVFRQLAWSLAGMLLLSLFVVARGCVQGYRSGGWLLPFCFLLPLAALAVAMFWFGKPDPARCDVSRAGQKRPAYIASLSLLLILVAIVPAAGLFGVCQAYEARLYLMHWQRALLNSVTARRERMAAAVEGSQALSDPAKAFIRRHFLRPDGLGGATDSQKHVRGFWHTTVDSGEAGVQISPTWWQGLLSSIRQPEAEIESMETGALARAQAEGNQCQWQMGKADQRSLILTCQNGSKEAVTVQSMLPDIKVPSDPYWWVVALVLLGAVYAWNCLAFSRLFNLDFRYTPLPLLSELEGPAELKSHLLVFGLPLARKDAAVREWLKYTPPRVNLYEAHFTQDWLEQTVERLKKELMARATVAAQAATAGGSTVASERTVATTPWVHISNLEAKLGDTHERQVVASLMERLILTDVNGMRVRLAVTSAVDPVFHFDSVLFDERKKIYEHPLPEPELQRLARLLHNFRKTQVSSSSEHQPKRATNNLARQIVDQECSPHPALLDVGEEVLGVAKDNPDRETLLAMVAERALALYKLFWAVCTRSEKLLLIQLAQNGLVNPLCLETLEDLVRKGLVLPGPRPRIMNETFRRFLEKVEGPETVRQWEGEAGESSWLVIRNVVVALLALGLVVLALTQQPALQTVTAILTGVGTVLAGLFRVFGFFGTRGGLAAGKSARAD
jgi:hypothetical protein